MLRSAGRGKGGVGRLGRVGAGGGHRGTATSSHGHGHGHGRGGDGGSAISHRMVANGVAAPPSSTTRGASAFDSHTGDSPSVLPKRGGGSISSSLLNSPTGLFGLDHDEEAMDLAMPMMPLPWGGGALGGALGTGAGIADLAAGGGGTTSPFSSVAMKKRKSAAKVSVHF